jgi:polyisoprenoid-binding protein YceI
MESSRYPRSTFKGTIADINKIDFSKDGTWPVNVSGELLIHGITKSIAVPGKIIIKGEKVSGSASFKIVPKDYNIKIPSLVSNKIEESIDVTVDCLYQKK